MDGKLVKMDKDYSKDVDVALEQATRLQKVFSDFHFISMMGKVNSTLS